jgi:hypothetical protein
MMERRHLDGKRCVSSVKICLCKIVTHSRCLNAFAFSAVKMTAFRFMKNLYLSFLLLTFFALSVFGQTGEARKIDEFGVIPCDEYLARADAMIVVQANNPGAMMYVFIYEGKEKRAVYRNGKFVDYSKSVLPQYGLAKARIESMKKYLTRKKIPLENYVFANGGFREDFWVEIWLVPAGAEPPTPTPTVKKFKFRKGKASGFCLDCC